MKLSRLWQPRRGLFWMMLVFNLLSSLCSWALRSLPLNTVGTLLIGGVALLNVGCGLLAAWMLVRDEPPAPVGRGGAADNTRPGATAGANNARNASASRPP